MRKIEIEIDDANLIKLEEMKKTDKYDDEFEDIIMEVVLKGPLYIGKFSEAIEKMEIKDVNKCITYLTEMKEICNVIEDRKQYEKNIYR